MNWVEAEVRVALSRATADEGFLFIPALAADSAGSSALPPFAKLSQGVRDPLGNGGELAKLLKAVLKSDWETSPSIQEGNRYVCPGGKELRKYHRLFFPATRSARRRPVVSGYR